MASEGLEYTPHDRHPFKGEPCKYNPKQRWLDAGSPLIHNFAHNTAPDDAVYCGRGSPYGNRFQIGPDGGRDTVIEKYETEVLPTLDTEPLRGRDCVCFCAPKRCHVESIFMKLYGYVPPFHDYD